MRRTFDTFGKKSQIDRRLFPLSISCTLHFLMQEICTYFLKKGGTSPNIFKDICGKKEKASFHFELSYKQKKSDCFCSDFR